MVGGSLPPLISTIIPCWNDAAALSGLLKQLRELDGLDEIIVADASALDTCADMALSAGAHVVRCERPSRGAQMNAGARLATGRILLFQHADTELRQTHVDALHSVAAEPNVIGGAFHRKFDSRHESLRWLEPIARVWAEFGGSFYGDQSIFVRRTAFEELGGYAEIPLMEDLEISRRLRRYGRTVLLDPPIASSPRHAERHGAWRTTFRNSLFIAMFYCGVSPETLHRWYYRLPFPRDRKWSDAPVRPVAKAISESR